MKFYNSVRHLLDDRGPGFDYMMQYLSKIEYPIIVETGCARVMDNYGGDGQSSLIFDNHINEYAGEFYTVDISQESVAFCRDMMVCPNTTVTLENSLSYLRTLNRGFLSEDKKIDLLYLDSMDAPRDDPATLYNSAKHHLFELMTILPSLNYGALIVVDDNWVNPDGTLNGKGLLILDYMQSIGIPLVFAAYQLFWIWKV